MPRKATGSVIFRPHVGCWEAIVTSPDRSRKWIKMRKFTDPNDREGAKAQAQVVSDRWRARGYVDDDTAETLNEYFKRWCAERRRQGLVSVSDDEGRYDKWIAEDLGALEIAHITPEQLEDLVAKLDEAVRDDELAWKTAKNVWGILTKLFDDAVHSKDRTLRARKDDPSKGVRAPDVGDKLPGPYLFPRELAQLLALDELTAQRRWLWAIAAYTGMRAGEIRALDWADIHEAEGFIHVHRAAKRGTTEIKSTKSGAARKVPIEPELLPLLGIMRDLSDGKGLVFPTFMARNTVPRALRSDLLEAGVTRRELHVRTETTRKLDFHDLRHTYGTWRAIRGDNMMHIKAAMGHADYETTQRYINEAIIFDRERFGVPFGPLPIESLLKRCKQRYSMRNYSESWWRRRESNLAPFERTAWARRLEKALERWVGRAMPSDRNAATLAVET